MKKMFCVDPTMTVMEGQRFIVEAGSDLFVEIDGIASVTPARRCPSQPREKRQPLIKEPFGRACYLPESGDLEITIRLKADTLRKYWYETLGILMQLTSVALMKRKKASATASDEQRR